MRWVLLAVVVLTTVAVGQNLVPNPSFERGKETPSGWQLNGGMGKWETFGRTGSRSLSVTGTGTDSNAWECTDWRPESGRLYLLRYFVCRSPQKCWRDTHHWLLHRQPRCVGCPAGRELASAPIRLPNAH